MANSVNAVMFVAYGLFGISIGSIFLIAGFTVGGASSILGAGGLGLASLGYGVLAVS